MSRRTISGCDAAHPDRRGGQHVAKPCCAVMVIDEDLGIGVMVRSDRSQHANRELAERYLDILLAQRAIEEDDWGK